MIDGACLHGDGENGQSVAGGGCFLSFRAAVGPEYRGDGRRAADAYRIALYGLCVFAIDVDDAVWAIGRRGIGGPSATIIRGQRRGRRSIKLAEHDGERGNRRAGKRLRGIAAAGYHDYCQ